MANFIKRAIKHPGALTAAAKRAGESVSQFERTHDKGDSKTAQRARFAEFLNKVRPR